MKKREIIEFHYTALIPLTKGHFAFIDIEDIAIVNRLSWSVSDRGKLKYARCYLNKKIVYLHRYLLDAPKGYDVDHINGDGLDNRRENLRLCTRSQNIANSRKLARGTSKYKGVCFDKEHRLWMARIKKDWKYIYLGRFANEANAAKAYDKKAVEIFGEFANTNF